ncbi:MAG: gliding motility protein GldL [Bacteroidaceae bacterium]|nr:gliding motility protein GldL [Bacteroidaceae bacterium]
MPKKANPIVNLVARMQRWMDSVPGQTFLNYAYNWGASIVILGTLFKLTHIAGANLMLFVGMGTEVFVFFISAFDRPFDKTGEATVADDYVEEEEGETVGGVGQTVGGVGQTIGGVGQTIGGVGQTVGGVINPIGGVINPVGGPVSGSPVVGVPLASSQPATGAEGEAVAATAGTGTGGTVIIGGGQGGGGTVVIGGGAAGGSQAVPATGNAPQAPLSATDQIISDAISAAMPEGGEEADRLAKIIRMANDELLHRAQAVLSPDMEAASQDYIEKLRTLTDTLQKVDEQSSRLTRDSQEMENLNRTLIGINKIYELHFASISKQVTTIEQINDQTRELAKKIDEVNQIYARMMQQLNIMANPAAAGGDA